MPTNHVANPAETLAPSPAPGPGVLPTVVVPLDGEAANAASVTQAMEVNSDFIGHIQSSVRLDTPVVAGSLGFTTVTYNGFGSGTLTPSNAKIAAGLRVVVKIVTPGAAGVATYVISTDGGATFSSSPQTSGTPAIDSTTGIWLTFGAGTFNANGTASFRSGYTPQAQWVDAAGNARSMFDHNGYRRGRYNEYYEDWLSLGNAGLTGAVSSSTGRLAYNLPVGCSASIATGVALPGAGPYMNISTTNIANATSFRLNTPIDNVYFQPATSLVLEFEILMISQSAIDWQFGLMNSGVLSGTPSNSETGLTLGLQATDTKWQMVTANGSAFTKTNTNITPATTGPNPDRITIELHGASSPYGSLQNIFINDNLIASLNSATAPAVNFGYSFVVIGTTTSGTNSGIMRISPVRMIWNRYLSMPSV